MKSARIRRHFAIVALLLSGFTSQPQAANQDSGIVERVIDGDTVILTGIGAVRLIGVDTPETVHPNKPVEAFGLSRLHHLAELVG